MVHHFGQGNNAKGYQITIGIFSALAVVLFFITFATTRERIQPAPDQQASVSQHFADLLKNGPWLVMFLLTLVLFITLAMRGSVVPYYFNYYADKASLARLLGGFGVNVADEAAVVSFAFSVFNVLGTLATIIAIFFSKALATKYGKRNVFIAGLGGTVFFTAIFALLPATAVTAMFVSEILRQFCVRLHHPAAVGDDGRRGGLLGVEDGPPGHGDRVRGHRIRAEGGVGLRRCDYRLRAVALRLRTERGAGGVGTGRHPADDEHLPGNHVCDLRRLPVLLRHRQEDRD